MTKAELNRKTETELATIAADMGLTLNADTMSKVAMVSQILTQQELLAGLEPVDAGEPADEFEDEPTEVLAPTTGRTRAKAKKYRIVVHNQEGPDNTPFITVGVNGTVWQINRDAEVVVPEEVKHVLENAVVTRFEPGPDNTLVAKDARRFPFSVLGEVA